MLSETNFDNTTLSRITLCIPLNVVLSKFVSDNVIDNVLHPYVAYEIMQ
jgi:hypothetical protein